MKKKLLPAVVLSSLAVASIAFVGGPFPAQISLIEWLPANGADGSRGFVVAGTVAPLATFGSAMSVGDINADGHDDLIVADRGSNILNFGGNSKGNVFVLFGPMDDVGPEFSLSSLLPANGGDGSRGFIVEHFTDFARTGAASSGGDVNGDGIDDILIGAFRAGVGDRDDAGEAYVIFGSSEGFPPVVSLIDLFEDSGGDGSTGFVLEAETAGDFLGIVVNIVGDINNDGIDDLQVSANRATVDGVADVGRVYVVYGDTNFAPQFSVGSLAGANGGDGSQGFVMSGTLPPRLFSSSAKGSGDINGDGIDDLAFSLLSANNSNGIDSGVVYVLYGRDGNFASDVVLQDLTVANGGDGSTGFVINGIDSQDRTQIGGFIGDVNADGIEDLSVSAFTASPGGNFRAGRSYIVFGKNEDFGAEIDLADFLVINGGDGGAGFVLDGVAEQDNLREPNAAGDLNSDGIDDFVLCAAGADRPGAQNSGECYAWYGRSSGFPAQMSVADVAVENGGDGSVGFRISGVGAGDSLLESTNAGIDINGDAADDLILSAVGADTVMGASVGEMYAIFGTPVDDADEDGLNDVQDNCIAQANADQRDTDGDGIGNICDADLNNDCVVNVSDLGLLRLAFFGAGPDADFDGDGVVNVTDLGILRALFFGVPGPSGVANACQ